MNRAAERVAEANRIYSAGSSAWHMIMGGVRRWQQIPDVSLRRDQLGAALLQQLELEDEALTQNHIDALEQAVLKALAEGIGAMRAWADENGRRDLNLSARKQLEEML